MNESPSSSALQDRIFLRALSVECIIGFIDWERRMPQTLLIDLEFGCDCRRAALHDDVADTVDYKQVAKRVLAWVGASQFNLVETLAHRLALLLLAEFPIPWIRITINKAGAIRHSRDVGITIERHRDDPDLPVDDARRAAGDAGALTS